MTAGLELQTLDLGSLRMRVATQGSGPLVLLCHGFPELWVSWRSQLAALAHAGFRAAAPDMRGYGGTDAPDDPVHCTMLHHTGDMVALVRALGERQAVIVGHDWGAAAAWTASLLRPDVFRAVVSMCVPFTPPSRLDLLTAMEQRGVRTFYMQLFQTPGVAEAEFEADPASSLRRVYFSMSADGPGRVVAGILEPGQRFLDNTVDPPRLPEWLDAEDLAYAAAEFSRTGFRGGLNWYRAIRLNAELLAPWHGEVVHQPSLFIAGAKDDVLRFPGAMDRVAKLPQVLPGLRGSHVLPDAGHWLHRERAERVNELLIEFLRAL